jgi:hypothetical protein
MREPRARCSQGGHWRSLLLSLAALLYVAVLVGSFSSIFPASLPSQDGEKTSMAASAPSSRHDPVEGAVAPFMMLKTSTTATEEPTVTAANVASRSSSDPMRGRRTMVLLANYRDSKRCGETLASMFTLAAAPQLLRVSIHDQIDETERELPCVESYCLLVGERECRRTQIVSTQVKAIDARGPIVARSINEKAIRDEEFCFGIDSHLVFTPQWDEAVVKQWEATGNANAIITVYPKLTKYMSEDHSKDDFMGFMCQSRFEQNETDVMVQYANVRWLPRTNATRPRLQSQYAGGFNFGSCRAYTQVPNDPFLPILFYGEEYVRGARLWTAGFDFYAPSVDIVYHYYERRKRVWDEDWSRRYVMLQRSKRRARAILGLPVSSQDFDATEMEMYGLGTKRTFAQWTQFTGMDPATYVKKEFDNCGELRLVPFSSEGSE